jgi:2-polyprenyl-6-methoxyphenol hydroxylase-like FAD-dependent oxidoreductase
VHREVLERMGLWEPIVRHSTPVCDLVLLNRRGRPAVTLPSVMMSGDVEILRGDLSRLLYERSAHRVCYRFDDQITGLAQSEAGVTVRFRRSAPERYDLVVGADGLHSGVRSLAFGDEARFLVHHGYRLATFTLPDVLDLGGECITYSVPRRSVTLRRERAGRLHASFIFAGPPLGDARGDATRLRRLVREAYRDVGWEVPRVLSRLDDASDLYVDQIASVSIDRYAEGRIVLLGDAAYGATLGGQGTPLAIVGAHVLAGELDAADGDVRAATARYEAHMRPYAKEGQKGARNVGRFFAPRTTHGLLLRDLFYRAMTTRPLSRQFEKLVKASASSFELPHYPHLQSAENTTRSRAG